MKIGIMTFHWATNYGAVLQAYALQEYLISKGFSVEIINYKPRRYDYSWLKCLLTPRNLIRIDKIVKTRRKEKLLSVFRMKYLLMTCRYYSISELRERANNYDILISGSDQILNPSFTTTGENGPTSAYYLDFGGSAKRIGYAVSFGCVKYPEVALPFAMNWINNFSIIGVREDSGINLLASMGFTGQCDVVPDPTLLIGTTLFKRIGIDVNNRSGDYTCIYMLRREMKVKGNVRYIDEKHRPLSMEDWLKTIVNSKLLITNSYHGMIMAILAHVPFVVMLESGYAQGMNDRFYTLLNKLELEDRIVDFTDNSFDKISSKSIDWKNVDKHIDVFRKEGFSFLDKINYESALV